MTLDNQDLAAIIAGLYYGEYEGTNTIEAFIRWLENDCPETEEISEFDDYPEDDSDIDYDTFEEFSNDLDK